MDFRRLIDTFMNQHFDSLVRKNRGITIMPWNMRINNLSVSGASRVLILIKSAAAIVVQSRLSK